MPENYSSITASNKILACLGEDGQLKALFWPNKDSKHSHLEFSICGFAVENDIVWLDPIRDNMHISFCPSENTIIVSWELKHPKLFDTCITKKTTANDSSLIEKWIINIPQELSTKKINLWLLSSWKINAEKRFQTVYTETGEDIIFAYSGNTWVGVAACNASCYSHFQFTRALQNIPNVTLGETLEQFLREPNRFRRIEMGNVYAAACTQPLSFSKCKIKQDKYVGEISILYEFGTHQEDLEQKISLHFDNATRHTEENSDINFYTNLKNINIQQKREYLKKVSLFVLNALTNEKGGIIAAPECDLDFNNSGGYGFIWPRDAAFCALGLIRCKAYDSAKQILNFLAHVQNQNGDYFQRFYTQGNKAPGWCELQADQLGLVIVAMLEYLKYENNASFLQCIKKGILKLTHDFSEKGSLQNSFDLWEEHYGLHFYAHACAYAALIRSLPLLPELEQQIKSSIQACEHFCQQQLFISKQKRFARSIDPHNNRDLQADISLLACIFPFPEFPIEDSIKLSIFEFCYDKLTTKFGTLRYEKDHYMGGNSWVLSGFWMAQAARELSKSNSQFTEIAHEIFEKTTNLCNEAGFYSEQIDSNTGKPLWVIPLAWSHAFYLWTNEDFI